MSITRAFTLRSKTSKTTDSQTIPLRAGSMRSSDKTVDIRTISGPIVLVSTTNTNLHNVPDVSTIRAQRKASNSISSASSRNSADNSIVSDTSCVSASTDITAPASPPSSDTSIRNYFKRSPRRSASSVELHHLANPTSVQSSPDVPSRAPSHSKQAHERLARQRSSQQISSHNSMHSVSMTSIRENQPTSVAERRSSFDFFTADLDKMHPFGKELEQLDEVVEQFGETVKEVEKSGDFAIMEKNGCARFCAEEYLREIRPLFSRIFEPQTSAWI